MLLFMTASVAYLCNLPILTGFPSATSLTQASSHSVSVGQTLAHIPPKIFWSKIVFAASSSISVEICRIKRGMFISVGHAEIQGAS